MDTDPGSYVYNRRHDQKVACEALSIRELAAGSEGSS
jgi:hypothetical protein